MTDNPKCRRAQAAGRGVLDGRDQIDAALGHGGDVDVPMGLGDRLVAVDRDGMVAEGADRDLDGDVGPVALDKQDRRVPADRLGRAVQGVDLDPFDIDLDDVGDRNVTGLHQAVDAANRNV